MASWLRLVDLTWSEPVTRWIIPVPSLLCLCLWCAPKAPEWDCRASAMTFVLNMWSQGLQSLQWSYTKQARVWFLLSLNSLQIQYTGFAESCQLLPLPTDTSLAQLSQGPSHLSLPVLPVFCTSRKGLQGFSKLPHCLAKLLFSDSGGPAGFLWGGGGSCLCLREETVIKAGGEGNWWRSRWWWKLASTKTCFRGFKSNTWTFLYSALG